MRTIPIMTGYLVLGFGFGILLAKAGYGVGWAFLMSLTAYSGTMQYVGVDLISTGASFITTAVMALGINARYMFYGLSMIDKFKGTGIKKPFLIFGLTDENYALICASEPPRGSNPISYILLIEVLDHFYWIVGGIAGNLVGMNATFDTRGIEFVMTALFVTVFVDQWREEKNHIPAISGILISVFFLIVLGPGKFIVPSMIAIVITLQIFRRRIDEQ